jgi:uncharacterized delta-60 repeat protein
MKKIIFILLISQCLSLTVFAQDWVSFYNGTGNNYDAGRSIQLDNAGNVYVTGSTSVTNNNADIITIKYSNSGLRLWAVAYNGIGNFNDYPASMAIDDVGYIYIAGTTYVTQNKTDIVILKYDFDGMLIWSRIYNGPLDSSDDASDIAVDNQDNVFIVGSTMVPGPSTNLILLKYNSSGVRQWIVIYSSSGNMRDYGGNIKLHESGNIYCAGSSIDTISIGLYSNYLTVKYNSTGQFQWVRTYAGRGTSYNLLHDMAVDNHENIYVTGCSPGIGTGFYDNTTIKYNSNGDSLWVRRYNGPQNGFDLGNSISVGPSGNIYIAGVTGRDLPVGWDFSTISYTPSGNLRWAIAYNGNGNDEDQATFLKMDSLENIYVLGRSRGAGTNYDFALVKYNSEGALLGSARYNGPGNGADYPSRMALDNNGRVYITGAVTGMGTNLDIATLRYSQPIGIELVTSKIPKEFKIYQNYPNPFNPTTKIKFDIPAVSELRTSNISLIIYNVLGKEISILVNEPLTPGTYEVNWNASDVPSGIYFYKLTAPDFTESKKMILIK